MSVFRRLYRGETNLDFVGQRKRWYAVSAVILLICIGSMIFRGFNFGVEFAGGNQFVVSAKAGTLDEVRNAAAGTGVDVSSAQIKGSSDTRSYVIRTPALAKGAAGDQQRDAIVTAISAAAHVKPADVNTTEVSSSWGKTVTNKAIVALVVFLFVVGAYIWIRFEQKMAIAALLALAHDLLLTAGVYSVVGFEVTPGTVIGLLTILGFSLYDTVVVFDKVDENSRGILGHNRFSYAEAANQAVNQTLMRSINTTLIALLPVGGLLFVGAGLLGVGALKDLALVLFVGMLTGAYSSLFLATPWLVDLKLFEPRYKLHAQRVQTRRVGLERGEGEGRPARAAKAATRAPGTKPAPAKTVTAGTTGATVVRGRPGAGTATANAVDEIDPDSDGPAEEATPRRGSSGTPPRPGARGGQRKRPGGSGRRR